MQYTVVGSRNLNPLIEDNNVSIHRFSCIIGNIKHFVHCLHALSVLLQLHFDKPIVVLAVDFAEFALIEINNLTAIKVQQTHCIAEQVISV